MPMNKFKRYELEGIIVDIPLVYNQTADKYIEEYPDFAAEPVYTAKGMPLTLCIEDACHWAEPVEKDSLIDCGDCRHFVRAAEKTLFGYCKCEMNRG